MSLKKSIIIIIALNFFIISHAQTPTPNAPTNAKPNITLLSKQVPILTGSGNILPILQNTVWTFADLTKNQDVYMLFNNNSYGNIIIPRGNKPTELPKLMFPILFSQAGNNPNESIVIVSSQTQILYYAMRLITPYYLLVSAGYLHQESVQNITIEEYFKNGNVLQLVY